MRDLQEQVKKALCYEKLFWPFTVWINCSSDLKFFSNSQPSALNFKSVSRSLEHFFLTVGQNNFGNKISFLVQKICFYVSSNSTFWEIPTVFQRTVVEFTKLYIDIISVRHALRNSLKVSWGTIVVKSKKFVCFFGELKIPKRYFKFNWPKICLCPCKHFTPQYFLLMFHFAIHCI